MLCKLLLFDLGGTLLQSDKTISNRTLNTLRDCRDKGILIGVSTSRSEQNFMAFLKELMPALKICVEIFDDEKIKELENKLEKCDGK